MRTVAPDNRQVWDEPRFRDTESRSPAEVGPIAYTVRLNVDGQSFTQPLTIVSDPHGIGHAG